MILVAPLGSPPIYFRVLTIGLVKLPPVTLNSMFISAVFTAWIPVTLFVISSSAVSYLFVIVIVLPSTLLVIS